VLRPAETSNGKARSLKQIWFSDITGRNVCGPQVYEADLEEIVARTHLINVGAALIAK
jgi:hypothetical protein